MEFSVMLFKKNKATKLQSRDSVANAIKPLIYFASLFGMQQIRFTKDNVSKVRAYTKLYSVLVILLTVALISFIRPLSWRDTSSDLPLYILTKFYGSFFVAEVVYSIFITTFGNSDLYVKLFKNFDSIDCHFGASRSVFLKYRVISVFIVAVPIVLVSGTVFLRKFNIVNIGQHFSYFMHMLQSVLIITLVFQIYAKQLMLNKLIMKKNEKSNVPQKDIIYGRNTCEYIFELIFMDSDLLARKVNSHYCWFELMQIYDKTADCIYYFNKIYAGQVFIMFNGWFMCTLLTICRSLSPTVKYSEVFLNDLFMYTSINLQPIFLAKICELFMSERKKTLSLLLDGLVFGNEDAYVNQIQTMVELVNSRKMEVSGNVFTADIKTVMHFAGRSISYTVLMIQYFYMRVFSNKV